MRMAHPNIIVDPVTAREILRGRKSQFRVIAGTPLAALRDGNKIVLKEPFIPVQRGSDMRGDISSSISRCNGVVFFDGWRRYRTGETKKGKPPTNPNLIWMPGYRMPHWASRITLQILSVKTERLNDITSHDARAEGVQPRLLRLSWQAPGPAHRLRRTPQAAFADYWNLTRNAEGERWEDNPIVVALSFAAIAP